MLLDKWGGLKRDPDGGATRRCSLCQRVRKTVCHLWGGPPGSVVRILPLPRKVGMRTHHHELCISCSAPVEWEDSEQGGVADLEAGCRVGTTFSFQCEEILVRAAGR